MALPEVIDLTSDGEYESPSNVAASTLESFVPRKEKAVSKQQNATTTPFAASTPQRVQPAQIAPRTLAPRAAPNATDGWTDVRPGASISEILSHGLVNAARSVGLLTSPHGQQQPPAMTPGYTNGSSPRNIASVPQQQDTVAPKSQENQRMSFVQHNPSPAAPKAQEARRTSGPLHEERQRRYEEYRRKETERKSESGVLPSVERVTDTKAGDVTVPLSVDRVAALAIQSASLSSQPDSDLPEAHWQRGSSPEDRPEAKRRKFNYERTEDAVGMIEARRLSATAISIANDLGSRTQTPVQPAPGVLTDASALPQQFHSTVNDKDAPVAAKAHQESIDLTEDMDISIDSIESSIVVNRPLNKYDSERRIFKPAVSADLHSDVDHSESDSPDEIPAKPVQKRPSDRQRVAQPHSTAPPLDAPEVVPKRKFEMALKSHLETKSLSKLEPRVPGSVKKNTKGGSNHGIQYSAEEDALLKRLREKEGVSWDKMPDYFRGRTLGSLKVRYSSKLKNRKIAKPQLSGLQKTSLPRREAAAQPQPEYIAPSRRRLKAAQRNDGFVTWAEVKAKRQQDGANLKSVTPPSVEQPSTQIPGLGLDVAHPASLPRILRSRELGNTARRNWSSTTRMKVSDELQNHVLDTLGPRRYFHGASHDVTCVAWAHDDNKFAAGAIAIDDERSMQYNRPNNLLLGDLEKNSLRELPEHHVARPTVSDSRNVNSLHAMEETQDPRLFKTVAAVAFSEDSKALYSAGSDGIVRMYDTSRGLCLSSVEHEAEVALLTSNSKGLLASGSHRSDDGSISVIRCNGDRLKKVSQLGPMRSDVESSLPIYPSSLKWGAGTYSHLLLAGFASDSYEDDRLAAGEIFLWDSTADRKFDLPTARNVFDVAWNPFPSSGASLFAVAGARSGRINRSSIQCFAPDQGRASRVLEWDCPAFDINDVVYCPHDDNIIAAGATDGKVYIWDKRSAGRDQKPLHILAHGQTKNVLDHDRDVEIADTGVRFLSWSATGDRLYSGSSDGTVKLWNPYRTTQDALVRDVATFNSAVMSGAFSPDYRDLLIGEDQGQLNMLGIDREQRSVRAAKKFDYYPAPIPDVGEDKLAPARELLNTGQIEIRPMGMLPFRQAVQGPNYQGPFLAPSDDQVRRLEVELQAASHGQIEARKSLVGGQVDEETKKAIKAAGARVLQVRQALERAQEKREDYSTLAPAASLLQKMFHESNLRRSVDDAMHGCRLDCNYLPAAGDEDGEAPDGRRSEQRIPASLRLQRKVSDTADMTNAEITEAGLTSKCSACTGPAAKSKHGLPLCERCTLSRSGFTARCEKCAAPVCPNLDERIRPNICERCSFHCFRCGCIATVSPAGDTITCEPCDMRWEAGVLGYEVKRSFGSLVRMEDQSHEELMETLDQRMGKLLGEDERDRLAGGWKVALVDGSTML